MDKKWSCPACDYKSGRQSNVSRHIDRKHGNYEVPVLTEVQNTSLSHQANSRDYSYPYHIPSKASTRTFWRRKKQILSYRLTNLKIKYWASIKNFLMH